jgi:hypothetical protein
VKTIAPVRESSLINHVRICAPGSRFGRWWSASQALHVVLAYLAVVVRVEGVGFGAALLSREPILSLEYDKWTACNRESYEDPRFKDFGQQWRGGDHEGLSTVNEERVEVWVSGKSR